MTAEPTQMFHVALDRAQALRTEAYPGNRSLADAYGQAVVALRRAWIACESYGKKVGTSYLEPADRTEMGTAVKLYNHAISGATPAEQAAYYGRVRDIITKLVERGVLHPPKVQLAQLEAVTRRAIGRHSRPKITSQRDPGARNRPSSEYVPVAASTPASSTRIANRNGSITWSPTQMSTASRS